MSSNRYNTQNGNFCETSSLIHQGTSFCGTFPKSSGYITGVFDLPHEAHFRLLKAARERCDYLIVGLTTDSRCISEKRKPIMSYEQRRAVLENSKWVDLVVANTGQTKQSMYKELGFDVLFTTDEYINRTEFTSFKSDFPNVRVIAFPVMGQAHTSDIIKSFETDIINSIKVLCIGVAGPIYEINRRDTKLIIKPINIGSREADLIFEDSSSVISSCANIYNLPFPLPRNWKKLNDPGDKPNITGINSFREIAICQYTKKYKWNVVTDCKKMFSSQNYKLKGPRLDIFKIDPSSDISLKKYSSLKKDANIKNDNVSPLDYLSCNEERKNPHSVYWLYQERCVTDLYAAIVNDLTNNTSDSAKKQHADIIMDGLYDVCFHIHSIIVQDLIPNGIIHGDLHMKNIGLRSITQLNKKENICLLDWGWCMHYSFEMACDENICYNDYLENAFDWIHFVNSVEFDLVNMNLFPRECIDAFIKKLKKI